MSNTEGYLYQSNQISHTTKETNQKPSNNFTTQNKQLKSVTKNLKIKSFTSDHDEIKTEISKYFEDMYESDEINYLKNLYETLCSDSYTKTEPNTLLYSNEVNPWGNIATNMN